MTACCYCFFFLSSSFQVESKRFYGALIKMGKCSSDFVCFFRPSTHCENKNKRLTASNDTFKNSLIICMKKQNLVSMDFDRIDCSACSFFKIVTKSNNLSKVFRTSMTQIQCDSDEIFPICMKKIAQHH